MAIQLVPRRSKAGAFADLFGGALQGINQGQAIARQRAQDDAMAIWKMAQYDPLVLKTPQAQRTFELAGWPVPKMEFPDIGSLMGEQAGGLGVTGFERDPMTGRVKGVRYGQPVAPRTLRGKDVYYQWSPQEGTWVPTDVKSPQGNLFEQWLNETGGEVPLSKWMENLKTGPVATKPTPQGSAPASPASLPPPGSAFPAAATPSGLTANDMLGMSEKWLEPPSNMVPAAPKRKPTPFIPPFGGVYANSAAASTLRAPTRRQPAALGKGVTSSALATKPAAQQSPYKEYPDAFLEDGVWKVIRKGKKYRIVE